MASKSSPKSSQRQSLQSQAPSPILNPAYLAAGLALAFASYLVFHSLPFLLISVILAGSWLYYDFKPLDFTSNSLYPSAKEVLLSLLVAYFIWVSLQLILSTSTPIDVVTSCSMVPTLQRGDLIFLSGTTPNVPEYDFTGNLSNLQAQISLQKEPCSILTTSTGATQQGLCTTALYYAGEQINAVTNNDIVVYDSDIPSLGLIVHRAVVSFSNGTNTYYFTKGDNNPVLDQESLLGPIDSSQIEGHVVGRIPYLGFIKLFLFLQFAEPEGCDQIIQPY